GGRSAVDKVGAVSDADAGGAGQSATRNIKRSRGDGGRAVVGVHAAETERARAELGDALVGAGDGGADEQVVSGVAVGDGDVVVGGGGVAGERQRGDADRPAAARAGVRNRAG